MLEGMAEYYSAELSEKIHRGQKENALKCHNNGGPPPFGYILVDHHLQIDPATAPVILEIFKRYAEGETLGEIIGDLNKRGIKTRKGKEFKYSSFNKLLQNRAYIGEFHYSDTVIPDGVPAIVPQELFDRVQMRRERNKRAPAAAKADDKFLLTTKLFCGKCGQMMVGDSGTSHTGKAHYYYKCGHAKRKKGCDKKAVKKEWIENPVLSREQIKFFLDQYKKTDTTNEAQRQRLIDCFVNAVFVYDDRIVLTFNYKDGTKTITLDDVNSSDMVGNGPLFFL